MADQGRSYNDHGSAFSPDGGTQAYAPAPVFTVHSTEAMISRLAYEMWKEAETARISFDKLARLAEYRDADAAAQDQRVTEAMDACEKALANAIAALTKTKLEAA